MNQYPNAATPAQLGVRPAPALVQQLLIGAFGWMFAGLLLTAGVAYLTSTSEAITQATESLWLPLLIGQFVLVMVIAGGINRLSAMASLVLFFVYAATMGLTIGVIIQFYTSESVASAFLASSAMFGGAAIYGRVTNRDLSRIGSIAIMALFGLFAALLINIFLHSSQMNWILSIAGVGIFTVLTAWDVQRIVNGQLAAIVKSAERATVIAALQLYLDFINIFLFMLRLFGSSRN
ncbi:MAG TPA: Bax inhibitor-1/YccA family protein [Candidatus Limnocylindrales bacterium]